MSLAGSCLLLSLLAAPAGPLRVGVIATGDGATTAAAQERAIEARLLLVPSLAVKPAAELASRGPVAGVPGPGGARITALLDDAEKSYYSGRIAIAAERLKSAEDLLAGAADVGAERLRFHTLRIAVRLKDNDTESAIEEAKKALALDPSLRVDAYPPSVQDVVEKIRQTLPPRVSLRLVTLPVRADLRFDGRLVPEGVVAALPGRHEVSARAPGFRKTVRTLEIAAPQAGLDESVTVRVPLSLALAPADDVALAAWAKADGKGDAAGALTRLADRWGLDAMVVLASDARAGGTASRAFLWRRDGTTTVPSAIALLAAGGTSAALEEWASQAVLAASTPTPVATPAAIAIATPDPNPAIAPRAATSSGAKRERSRKPLVWGAIGAGVLALGAGAAVAASSGGGTKTTTRIEPSASDTTTIGWD